MAEDSAKNEKSKIMKSSMLKTPEEVSKKYATPRLCNRHQHHDEGAKKESSSTGMDDFIIGDRVYVGGTKSGRIAFVGEVHFAPGTWAGVVLEEPEGKNDGEVSGHRYFQCEQNKGIFSRLNRLTREPSTLSTPSRPETPMNTSTRSFVTPERARKTSPTPSTASMASTSAAKKPAKLEINDRVIVKSATGSKVGTLRFIGETHFATGTWCGIEFEDATGKNDGSVGGQKYFTCEDNHGLFVPESKVVRSPMNNQFSRQNTQESLISKLSLTSNTASKLRYNANTSRLSSVAKSPSAAQTSPRPSFSLQEILQEKTNHIERLMKERENDREEMSTQSIKFQHSINMYKEKVGELELQLEEEKKKCEDLQFIVDESAAAALATEENEFSHEDKNRLHFLENEYKKLKDQQSAPAGSEENTELKLKLDSALEKLEQYQLNNSKLAEELKNANAKITTLEIEIDGERAKLDNKNTALKHLLDDSEKHKNQLNEENSNLKDKLKLLEDEIKTSQDSSSRDFTNANTRIKELENELSSKQDMLKNSNEEIVHINEKLRLLEEQIESSSRTSSEEMTNTIAKIKQLETEVGAKQDSLNQSNEKIVDLNEKIIILQKNIESFQAEAEKLKAIETEKDQKTEEIIKKKDVEIEKLCENIKKLETEMNSINNGYQSQNTEIDRRNKAENEIKDALNSLRNQLVELFSNSNMSNDLITTTVGTEDAISEIKIFQKSILQVAGEIQKLKKVNSSNEEEIKKASEQIENLQNLLANSNAKIQNLESALDESKHESESLRNIEIDLRNQIEELILQNKTFVDEKASLLATRTDVEKQYDDLLKSIEIQKQEYENRLDHINQENVKLKDEMELLLEQKIENENQLNLELQNFKSASDEEKVLLSTTFDDERRALRGQIEEMQQYFESECHKLLVDKKESTHDLLMRQNELKLLEEKIESLLQEKISQEKEFQFHRQSLEQQIQSISEDKDLTQNKLDEKYLNMSKAFSNLEAENVKMTESLMQKENDIKKLMKQNEELTEEKKSIVEEITKKNSELTKLLEDEKIQKENIYQQLNAIDAEKLKLHQELSDLKENFDSKTSSQSSEIDIFKGKLQATTAELNSKIRDLESESLTLKDALNAKDSSLKNLQQELTDKIGDYESQISLVQNKLSSSEKQYEEKSVEWNNAIEIMRSQLTVAENLSAKKNEENEKLQQEIIAIKTSLESQIDMLSKQNSTLEQKLTSETLNLTEKLEKSQEELKRIQASLVQGDNVSKVLEVELENSKSNEKLLMDEIDKFKKSLKSLEDHNAELKISLEKNSHSEQNLHENIVNLEGKLLEIQKVCSDYETVIRDKHGKIENLEQTLSSTSQEFVNYKRDIENKLSQHETDLKTSQSIKEWHEQNQIKLIGFIDDLLSCINKYGENGESDVENFKITLSKGFDDVNNEPLVKDIKSRFTNLSNIILHDKEMIEKYRQEISAKSDENQAIIQDYENKLFGVNSELSTFKLNLSNLELKSQSSITTQNLMAGKVEELQKKIVELELLNQSLQNDIGQSRSQISPDRKDASDQDLQDHINFLNSIIGDMHNKNLNLSKQIDVLTSASVQTQSSSSVNLEMPVRKKPAPRVFCDICDVFDDHETEDCPVQCSVDPPPRTKAKKLPAPRMFCEHCDEFDLHETEDCPEFETF